MQSTEISIEKFLGKTFIEIKGKVGNKELEFTLEDGSKYVMYHSQDCCEDVLIEDITGDLQDLIGSPIIRAEEASSNKSLPGQDLSDVWYDSFTWTFYKLATRKGYVDIRWLGTSNGHYSERVDIREVKENDPNS